MKNPNSSLLKKLLVILILCKASLSHAQSWTTSGDTISSTGNVKAADLNVTGSSVKMSGIVTESATDFMTIDQYGNLHPISSSAFNSILYPNNGGNTPDNCLGTSLAQWSYSNVPLSNPVITTYNDCYYVGIDVNNPTVPLEVGGNVIIEGLTTSHDLSVADNISICPSYCTGSGNAAFYEKPSPTYTTAIEVDNYSSGNPVFAVDKNGNTGIGTASPSAQLNISVPASSSIPAFSVNNSSGNVFSMDKNGNVFIQNPTITSYALNVQGTIWGTEVKVCMSGCDFVFDKGYKLMPMEDLEQYLQLNHHLPGIPSAKEMETNDGVALGKMNSQLLKKVEELTLYIIQQQKEIDKQNGQISQMNEKLNTIMNKQK